VAKPKVEYAERYAKGVGKWVDVGSGIGDLVSVLIEKGWDAIGLEISETSVAFAEEVFGISLLSQPFEAYCKENYAHSSTYDVVSFMGVLEHIINPMEFLNLASNLLRPYGIVMIQGPNADSISSLVQTTFPEHVFRHMSPVEHIMLFTEKSLLTALELTKFKPLAIWFHGLDIYELLCNLIFLNNNVQNSELLNVFLKNINELQMVFDKQGQSDLMICIAEKQG
jgi:2-polyprenyl-3-methyl-5-hydroxy-6-metoxy-1,4-benzoquinol methylase